VTIEVTGNTLSVWLRVDDVLKLGFPGERVRDGDDPRHSGRPTIAKGLDLQRRAFVLGCLDAKGRRRIYDPQNIRPR